MKQKFQTLFSAFLVALLVMQSLAQLFPVFQTVRAETERSLRVHLETDTIDPGLSLWMWGDVLTLSQDAGSWPNGSLFSEDNQTDFGFYQDVLIQEDAQQINMITVFSDGSRLIEDEINIEVFEELDEVWVRADGSIHLIEPVDFDSPTLRIHFLDDEVNYDDFGVWFWGDAPNQPSNWPTDAVPFSSERVGPRGAFVDLPVNENARNIGFLIVNRMTAEQTPDMSFNAFDETNQVFVSSEFPGQAFTDPFFRQEEVEPAPEPTDGEEDITVSASVTRAFNHNEHGILDVDIVNNSELEIDRIRADLTSIQGPNDLVISPELNRVTLSVPHTVEPGTYTITIHVFDENNGRYSTETEVVITERQRSEGERDWDEEIIYFMLTDRFYDGDPSNNDPFGMNYDQADNPRGTPQGGDFRGVTKNLDYLEELGVSTIWITPIVDNVAHDVEWASDAGSYFGYHGYWARDFEVLNPHLGTLEDFHELIDRAAERNISIMVDVVLNHPGYGLHPRDAEIENPPAGFPTDEDRARFEGMLREEGGNDDLTMELAGLPDFITEDPDVRNQLVEWQVDWLEKSTTPAGNSIASFRVDTVKHVDDTTWQHFKNELVERDPSFRMIGESWGAGFQNDHGYLNTGTMDSLLDFPFKDYASSFVRGNVRAANNILIARNEFLTSNATLGQFLGSHD